MNQNLRGAENDQSEFIEIKVVNPQTHGVGTKRFTDYEVVTKTNSRIMKFTESSVRRRFSDFEWLRTELERSSKMVLPTLPEKAWSRQLPFRKDNGIFDDTFIEERRKGLEDFINKVASHPLAQVEKCLHLFLQEETLDRATYKPEKVSAN